MSDRQYFLTCPGGFEHLLLSELESLGIRSVKESRGGVYFEGSFEEGMRVCLWSRIGGRLLLVIDHFEAETEKDIYKAVLKTGLDKLVYP